MLHHDYLSPACVELVLKGTLTAAEARGVDQVLQGLHQGEGSISVLIDISDLSDITAGPVLGGDGIESTIWSHLAHLDRVALVSPRQWAQVLMRALAGDRADLAWRVFDPAERSAAVDFALGQPEDGAALRLVPSHHPALIACEIDGVLNQADGDRIVSLLSRAAERGGVSLVARIRGYRGFEPQMLMSGPLWGLKLTGLSRFHRYAVIAADPWMQGMAQMANPFAMGAMRMFPPGAERDATAWATDGLPEPD